MMLEYYDSGGEIGHGHELQYLVFCLFCVQEK